MRAFTAFERQQIEFLTNLSIELTYLEPTETGLQKSIMDATAMVRSYLREKNIHDYALQSQGDKVIQLAYIVTDTTLVKTKVSLYRPKTKQGDPRIWFYGLHHHCQANDIIAVIAFDNVLYVINLSQFDIEDLYQRGNNPIYDLLSDVSDKAQSTAQELLSLLRKLTQDPIPTVTDDNSDTGIGRTLETLLGIEMNSNKAPDYKGIELKSARATRGKRTLRTRKTLFAQVPDWSVSQFKSSSQIVQTFGYINQDDNLALRCTVDAVSHNSQGLQLRVDDEFVYLHEFSTDKRYGDFATWRIETLHHRLRTKHRETFWITAKSIQIDGVEHFLYESVIHTKSPLTSQFVPLVKDGDITVDHMISVKNGRTKEKGPAFKLKPSSMGLLFPNEVSYSLS